MTARLARFDCLTAVLTAALLLVAQPSVAQERDFSKIFLDEDSDTFDPGLAIGEQFPAIRALYDGREIDNIDVFLRDKGAVFLAVRSADW